MSNDLTLDEVDIVQRDEHPPTESVKLNGPPGTGKTTQCAARVAELVNNGEINPHDITWVTYRKSLAKETRERLIDWGVLSEDERANPTRGATKYIGTFHAVASRTVGGLGDITQNHHKAEFCKETLGIDYWQGDRDPWESTPGQLWFDLYQHTKNNCLSWPEARRTDKYEEFSKSVATHPSLQVIEQKWEEYKEENEIRDYWEMLKAGINTDKLPPTGVVVIDEFHDAYPLMNKLAQKWIDAGQTVIVAGDPLQVVNAYRGADPHFFVDVDLPEVLLPKSYRLPESHWEAAKDIISNVATPPDIEITDKQGEIDEYNPGIIRLNEALGEWQFPDGYGHPATLVDDYGDDIMFLTRTRKQANAIAAGLRKRGVLYVSQSDAGGWNLNETKKDKKRLPLYNALQRIRGYSPDDFSDYGLGSYTGAEGSVESEVLPPEEAANLLNHAAAKHLDMQRDEAEEIADRLLEEEKGARLTEFDDWVKQSFWEVYTQGQASVRKLVRVRDENLSETLQAALNRNDGPVDLQDITTRVYTIHASKGSEANTVVLYDGTTGTIDSAMLHDVETERNEYRTWYVALTRAQENLCVIRRGFDWVNTFLPPLK